MGAEETRSEQAQAPTGSLERRSYPRHAVDCAVEILPVSGSTRIRGRLSDVSLGGCRVVTEQRYTAGIMVRVEAQFQLRGIAFRIVGVTVGSRDAKVFAVRFLDMPARRRNELAEVLVEVEAWNAAQAKAETPEPQAIPEPAVSVALAQAAIAALPEAVPELPPPMPNLEAAQVSPAPIAEQPSGKFVEPAPADPVVSEKKQSGAMQLGATQERRAQSRHTVDTSAKLLLVKTAISMPGRIVNLSLSGCRIRTNERFNVGIYVRVEAEFYLHGLPFRVGGVSQAILDKNTIGVRFLDMSDRRKSQLSELIAEIAEAAALGQIPELGEVASGEAPAAGQPDIPRPSSGS